MTNATLHKKLDYYLRRMERQLRVKVKNWLDQVAAMARKELDKIAKADLDADDILDWKIVESEGMAILNPLFLDIYTRGRKSGYETAGVTAAFNILEPAAVKAASKISGDLVKGISQESRKAIKTFITNGIEQGLANPEIAKQLKTVVGLTSRQAQSIDKLRTKLVGAGLTQKEINSKLAQARTLAYNTRLNTIARTETARAQTMGYVDTLDEVGVHQFEFSCFPGCCPICDSKEGNIYGAKIARDIIPVHPNCRCTTLPVVSGKKTE